MSDSKVITYYGDIVSENMSKSTLIDIIILLMDERDFDTPNEPYKMPSKEMEATRRYIPKIKILLSTGELREI